MAIRIIAGGDVMLGEHPAMVGRGVGTRLKRQAKFDPLVGISQILGRADVVFANLESAISSWPTFCLPSHRECRAPTVAIRPLAASGLLAVTIANNHIQQHGFMAVEETLSALSENGIATVGLAGELPGRCQPVDLETADYKLRLLGYSLRPRQHFSGRPLYAEGTPEGILADIHAGRASGRIVVVTIHWGDEFVSVPSLAQVALGRAMIDAGCALVVGHHPHVLQGWERYGNGAIFYSLGNLVFDMPWLPELRRTVLCECTLSAAGCSEIELHPLVLGYDHCPQPAIGDEREAILRFLAEARAHLEHGVGTLAAPADTEYQKMVVAAVNRERRARNRYFLRNLFRYRPDVAGQLISKFLLRRLGLLHD